MIFKSPLPAVEIPEIPYSAYVFERAQEWKDQPALIDGLTGRTLTFGQVVGSARCIASSLAARGMRKGDVLAVYSPNLPEYALAFHATLMAGGVVTTINPLYTPDELAFQLNDTGAKYLVTVPTFFDKAREAAAKSKIEEIFIFGEAEGATSLASLLKGDGQLPNVKINPREDVAVLPYSSGTSGRPKGVMLTHYNLVAVSMQGNTVTNSKPGDRVLALLPFYHIYGMMILMNNPLRRGLTSVTLPRLELEQFLRVIQDYRVTRLYLVPTIVRALTAHPLVDKFDLSHVDHITSGAAPLDRAIREMCEKRFGVRVLQGYGMTESSILIAYPPEGSGEVKSGSCGPLIPNMEAKIQDLNTGAELGTNQNGEICVRGPNIMKGYLNNPAATAQTVDSEHWLHTGDVGHIDEDNHVYIVDRVKELIKYKGQQVAPTELESVLTSHPAVADAAVIPIPDDEAGEIPKAFVVCRSPVSADELMRYVAGRVAPHKKVRRIEFVDTLPRTVTGKLLRRILVEQERARTQAA